MRVTRQELLLVGLQVENRDLVADREYQVVLVGMHAKRNLA